MPRRPTGIDLPRRLAAVVLVAVAVCYLFDPDFTVSWSGLGICVPVWLAASLLAALGARRRSTGIRLGTIFLILLAAIPLVGERLTDSLVVRLLVVVLALIAGTMSLQPRFSRTLHFRLSASFLVLIIAAAVGWTRWVESTVYDPDLPEGSEDWFDERSKAELDSVAHELAPYLSNLDAADSLLMAYYRQVARFDVEFSLVDRMGRNRLTTRPPESMSYVCRINTAVLDSMIGPEWDFSSYPDTYEMESFVNRITHVQPVHAEGDSTGEAEYYLVATFPPTGFTEEAYDADVRSLLLQGTLMILLAAAASGLIVMAWVSRRVDNLSRGVEAYRRGDLSRRVPAHGGDELGRLGHDFNMMALSLAELIERLQRSEQFHRRLVANMSHDLRTPLASLRGYTETLALAEQQGDKEKLTRYLERITVNVDHISRLIAHLFQLSHLDSGEARFNMEEFSVEELAADLLNLFDGLAEEQGVSLVYEAEKDLPRVHADPVQIGQALQNLMDNALKFCPSDGRVGLRLSACPRGVEVAVSDNGEGITPEDLPHITERFYTGDKSRTRKGESSGLGLAITEKILLHHASQLQITSDPGRETTFSFALPAADKRGDSLPV